MDHNAKPRIRDRGPDDQAFRLGELSQKEIGLLYVVGPDLLGELETMDGEGALSLR